MQPSTLTREICTLGTGGPERHVAQESTLQEAEEGCCCAERAENLGEPGGTPGGWVPNWVTWSYSQHEPEILAPSRMAPMWWVVQAQQRE